MGATKVSGVPLPQEVNFNDLFVTDIGTDGAIGGGSTAVTGGGVIMPKTSVTDTTSFGDTMSNFFGGGGNAGDKGGGSLGATLSGIGAVTGALASIYGIREQKKYQEQVLNMEKQRVAKNEARRDAKQAEYEKVWG